MAFSGLIALLDDVATIADDVATLTLAATKKTTGLVTDDMAVTAEQTLGIKRERELPVVAAVAKGSLINKALILAPGALLLNAVAPFVIHPILMAGGLFLSFEGVEKILHKFKRADNEQASDPGAQPGLDPQQFEQARVKGAIRTDLILSGEIIALTLGEVAKETFWVQVAVLYAVSVILTVGVYGMVGVLVKLDDVGAVMATRTGLVASAGRLVVRGAPRVLHLISWIGTVAMLVVGGHILLEGIPPLLQGVEQALHGLEGALSVIAGMCADAAVGIIAGLLAAGVVATGLPARLWRLLPKGKATAPKSAAR